MNTDGPLDTAFNPNANGFVSSIAVQADGKILVGGDFSGANSIGGQTRNFIARLNAATGLADSFNPNANLFVRTIAVQANGKILAGGYFNGANSIGGQSRNRIARLDPATGLADSFNPNASDIVRSITVQPDGKILVGGFFSGANSIGGQTRNFIARLDATTGLADSFNLNANSSVLAIAVQSDGKVLAGGDFTTLAPNGGAAVTRNNIARLGADGRLDQTLNLGTVNGFVSSTAFQPDGKILIGGGFTSILGVPRNRMARLNSDGTLDMAFNPNANDEVLAIVVQPDGKILVGGYFNDMAASEISIGGAVRNFIARLDPITGLADSFDPGASFIVLALVVQPDGKILASGYFTTIGGQSRHRIARLDPVTGLADSFNPNANSIVLSLALQTDGKILAGGSFTSIGGQPRNRIARIDPSTGLADSFDPNANDGVWAIAVQADGKILLGGGFTSVGGQVRQRIARLNAMTGLVDSFDPNTNGVVYSIAVQTDGKILAGGDFSGPNSIGGQTRNRIARLDPTTGQADSFDPNANGLVYTIALQPDGKILAGGNLINIGGQNRERIARLSNDTAARQDLAVTTSNVTWNRGGSSQRLRRATFEYSADDLNYIALGNGTPSGSSWAIAGLNLPEGESFYIRARGYYPGGMGNGSESMTELVRNVYPSAPTPTPTPTGTPTGTPTVISISGTVSNCANAIPSPVSAVTMNLTGSAAGSTQTDSSGNYQFSALVAGGSYTVTPAKNDLAPGSPGLDTVDLIATQRHFLGISILPAGCRRDAGDVSGDGAVTTVDVIAIQRFFLGLTTGIGNTGKYKFVPTNRSYPGIAGNQTGQNYDAFVFGDVVTGADSN